MVGDALVQIGREADVVASVAMRPVEMNQIYRREMGSGFAGLAFQLNVG